MSAVDIKDHIIKYVQALETGYTEVVHDLKDIIEKEKSQFRKVVGEQTNSHVERSELEELFVICIEEVRKKVMKRKLKHEIQNRT